MNCYTANVIIHRRITAFSNCKMSRLCFTELLLTQTHLCHKFYHGASHKVESALVDMLGILITDHKGKGNGEKVGKPKGKKADKKEGMKIGWLVLVLHMED